MVAPCVYLNSLFVRNTIDVTFENGFAINQQLGLLNTISIIGYFHVVVGPYTKAHLAPSCKLIGQIV